MSQPRPECGYASALPPSCFEGPISPPVTLPPTTVVTVPTTTPNTVPDQGLPVTGGDVIGLSIVGAVAVLAGAMILRVRRGVEA